MNDTVWSIITVVLSFGLSAVLGRFLVPFLKKLKYGQTILEIGPKWHKGKQGTPTMGGLMFIISSIVTLLVILIAHQLLTTSDMAEINLSGVSIPKILAGVFLALGYGAIGFVDDYIKVVKKRNLGFTAKQKLLLQFLVAGCYLGSLYLLGESTQTIIPFVGVIDLGFWYYIIFTVVIVGVVNAVNLTDGIDGLAGSVTFFAALSFMVISSSLSLVSANIMASALAGACLGFLIWNFHPAKVFMGDTGSLYLGGFLCAIAFTMNIPIIIIPIAGMYLIEMFSVILQVTYFKATKGKRLFKMSPIHHHFEMSGWSEIKITIVFSIVTLILGVASFLCITFGLK